MQVKEVLKNKDGNHLQSELPSCLKKLFGGDGLVAIRDEKWIDLRKLDNHTFHGEGLKVVFFTVFLSIVSSQVQIKLYLRT